MSKILFDLLDEVKKDGILKSASAPEEPPTVTQQNTDILEMSQATLAKIDSFIQQVNSVGTDVSGEQTGTGNGTVQSDSVGDPNDQSATGAPGVKLEVPAGLTVKIASEDIVDGDSAIKTIVGIMPSYFGV